MNSDCAQGLTCSFGRCQVPCKEARDCANGGQCVKDASGINTCLSPAAETCSYNSQCTLPLVCAVDLKCRNQCLADRDCATSTQKCVLPDGVCAEPSAINTNGTLGTGGSGGSTGMGGTTGQQCAANPTPACSSCVEQFCDSQATDVFGGGYRNNDYNGGVCPNLFVCECSSSGDGNMQTCAQQDGAGCVDAFAALSSCLNAASCGTACTGNGNGGSGGNGGIGGSNPSGTSVGGATGGQGGNPSSASIGGSVGSPERAIDILFMVDNSPSMDPKQKALADNFPKMIAALQALPGGLPDVHIGVVSSNMGAGNGAMGGNCGNGLGDRGLLWGNDPNDITASVAPGSAYTVTPAGCGLNSGARWISDIQDPNNPGRIRNYDTSMQLQDVFSCLAKAVGVAGCGEEHQLQATRVALIPQAGINEANNGFLRPNAYLAIVLITDEDDCSANNDDTKNDDMFNMSTKRDVGDTTSLRCAARGHLCGGSPIPTYDSSAGGVGYTGTTPFTHLFSDCTAKSQKSPADYAYMPLIDVQDMIDSVQWVKGSAWAQKILVSGIIGWPPGANDTNLPANLQTNPNYRIDKDSTSLPASQQSLWDYMPICSIPDQKSADGNIYKAYGGLRLKKFIDAFGSNGEVFSICNSDFTNPMTRIGNTIVQALK